MTDHRRSEVSLASELEDELDRIQIRDTYELGDISQVRTPVSPLHEHEQEGDEDAQRLLNAGDGAKQKTVSVIHGVPFEKLLTRA